jgi:PPM family protein phosphatase
MTKLNQSSWSVGARSETGYVRDENQDRMCRLSAAFGDVYIVSDGMGGHKAGALAAELTIQSLQKTFATLTRRFNPRRDVSRAFEVANKYVYDQGHGAQANTQGMGATAVVLITSGHSALVAHVGDSRAYLFRKGKLRRLTKDHTRVQKMIDAGMLSVAEAETHPEAGVLERAMGHKQNVAMDISGWIRLKLGDELLLCSDGLCGYANDSEIEDVLFEPRAVQHLANKLVDLALSKGGKDNVTVQLIRYGTRRLKQAMHPLLYQLAFLPLFALISAATSYGVFRFLGTSGQQKLTELESQTTFLRAQFDKVSSHSHQQSDIGGLIAKIEEIVKKSRAQAAPFSSSDVGKNSIVVVKPLVPKPIPSQTEKNKSATLLPEKELPKTPNDDRQIESQADSNKAPLAQSEKSDPKQESTKSPAHALPASEQSVESNNPTRASDASGVDQISSVPPPKQPQGETDVRTEK